MGIIAFCPRGHRLKLKDELAGRKGICPQCGDRFRIPRHSQDSPAAVPPAATSPHGLPVAIVVSLDAELAATLPRALPLAGGPGLG